MGYTVHVKKCDGTDELLSGYEPAFDLTNPKGYEERISESTGPERCHNVIHRKVEYDCSKHKAPYIGVHYPYPYGVNSYSPAAEAQFNTEYYSQQALERIRSWDLSPDPSPDLPTGWSLSVPEHNEQAIINSLLTKASQLKADVLLNIVEANQIWPSLKSLATCLPQMKQQWGKIRKVVRTASGAFLAWKFGISPLLSDLMNIYQFSPDMERRYEQYSRQENLRLSVFVPCNLKFDKSASLTQLNGHTVKELSYQGISNVLPGYRYVLVVKPTVPYKTEFFKRLTFILKRFSSSPAQLAWETIPFSFVVDWFVDVRGELNALDSLLGYKPYEIISCTKSLVYDMETMAFHINSSPCGGGPVWGGHVASCKFRHYERSNLSIPGLYPGWKGHFGKNQAAVSAALIAQKLSKLRAKRR